MASSTSPLFKAKSPITLILWVDWVETAILWAEYYILYLIWRVQAEEKVQICDLDFQSTYMLIFSNQKHENIWLLYLWTVEEFQVLIWLSLKQMNKQHQKVRKEYDVNRLDCFCRKDKFFVVEKELLKWTASFRHLQGKMIFPRKIYSFYQILSYSKIFYLQKLLMWFCRLWKVLHSESYFLGWKCAVKI